MCLVVNTITINGITQGKTQAQPPFFCKIIPLVEMKTKSPQWAGIFSMGSQARKAGGLSGWREKMLMRLDRYILAKNIGG